uniref:Tetratricopeptide repeat-like domain-containing protein n=1 Tax=Oryza meridionalis TaxID=40149 RepID=A0A0E0EA88_9ORYZ
MGAAGLPAPGCLQKFGYIVDAERFVLNMSNRGIHKALSFQCFASDGRGFGAGSTNRRKIKSKKRQKDVAQEPSKVISGGSKNRDQWVPELGTRRESKSAKTVMDKQFLEKVEAVRRSALEKKKADENKNYQAIDYDAPIESDKSTIGFGTRVGIGIAVVVFGLVFAFGDFLPYGSVSPSKKSTVVSKQLSEEEIQNFKTALEGFEATLRTSPNDPTALEGAAVSLVELGEYQKASEFLEKLVKVIPDKVEAYRLLGEVKFELKDYDGSSSSYRKSLSASDNIDFEVLRGLTNALLAAKKPDQAVDVILSCRQKLNEKSQTQVANLAAANDDGAPKSQDIDLIQAVTEVEEEEHGNWWVDLLLGKAYSDWGHISDAVAVYENLITEHPEDFRGTSSLPSSTSGELHTSGWLRISSNCPRALVMRCVGRRGPPITREAAASAFFDACIVSGDAYMHIY